MALAVLAACAPAAKPPVSLPAVPSPAPVAPPALTLSPVAFAHLPGWREDAHGEAHKVNGLKAVLAVMRE